MTRKTPKRGPAKKSPPRPKVSIITPTFNRRPFIPMAIQCVQHQTYPADRIEWVVGDDGSDPIGDLVAHLPNVKYLRYEKRMALGKKRNLCNHAATGDILVYMDDDDYYPPERIEHAVDTLLANPNHLIVGSSAMYVYSQSRGKMYQFGPYGPNHATAATMAFRRQLLSKSKFDETLEVAEEQSFRRDFPMVQLDPRKTILVVTHCHNTVDKDAIIDDPHTDPTFIKEIDLAPEELVREPEIFRFLFGRDHPSVTAAPDTPPPPPEPLNQRLATYAPGDVSLKVESRRQIAKLRAERETVIANEQAARDAERARIEADMPMWHYLISQKLIAPMTQENNYIPHGTMQDLVKCCSHLFQERESWRAKYIHQSSQMTEIMKRLRSMHQAVKQQHADPLPPVAAAATTTEDWVELSSTDSERLTESAERACL